MSRCGKMLRERHITQSMEEKTTCHKISKRHGRRNRKKGQLSRAKRAVKLLTDKRLGYGKKKGGGRGNVDSTI